MFKNLFSKKNMPIIIIVSVAVALSIVMITIGSVRLLKPWDGNSDGTNSNVSSSGSEENSKPLDGNFDDTNGTDKYQLTDIGYKLLKFGLNENIGYGIELPTTGFEG